MSLIEGFLFFSFFFFFVLFFFFFFRFFFFFFVLFVVFFFFWFFCLCVCVCVCVGGGGGGGRRGLWSYVHHTVYVTILCSDVVRPSGGPFIFSVVSMPYLMILSK